MKMKIKKSTFSYKKTDFVKFLEEYNRYRAEIFRVH